MTTMRATTVRAGRLQQALDWAVFGLGVLALSSAIVATVLTDGRARVAETPPSTAQPALG